jgi:excisionase family DNA binding protein
MTESLIKDIEAVFKEKPLLTMEDIATVFGCTKKVVYNWTRRSEISRRPPRVVIGRQVRFPRTEFIQWLVREQGRK